MSHWTPCLKNVNATNSTRAQIFGEDICALCAHSWLGELLPGWETPGSGARAVMKVSLTAGENCRMCVNTHIRKKFHIRDISKFGKPSIQVCIRFGFNDRVAFAGFSFEAPAIKDGNHSSTVTNQFTGL